MTTVRPRRWADFVLLALRNLGEPAHLSVIYEEVNRLCVRYKRDLPESWKDITRRVLQQTAVSVDGQGTWAHPDLANPRSSAVKAL